MGHEISLGVVGGCSKVFFSSKKNRDTCIYTLHAVSMEYPVNGYGCVTHTHSENTMTTVTPKHDSYSQA